MIRFTPIFVLLLLSAFPGRAAAQVRSIPILAAEQAPHIDGKLDDAIWQRTPFFSDFTQQSPNPLSAPDEQTEVSAAYTHSHLYVGVRCHIPSRHTIQSRYTRRDRDGDFDKLEIALSPTNDGKTGFSFIVNPSGIQQDGAWSDDTIFDRNWDATWEVATTVTDTSWTAEFAIPLDQLRFTSRTRQFGFQVKRWIAHRHQLVVLQPKHPEETGEMSRMARLTGTQRISPKLPLAVIQEIHSSYTTKVAGSDSTSPEGFAIGAGGYIKAGLAPGWTLDMALSPDFGEIEIDNAVVNLSNIETLYAEKRPFFLENRQLFITPIQLFYSRRLGEAPAAPGVADNESVSEGPLYTPLLLATKFSGTSASGISVGALHVLSEPTRVAVETNRTQEQTFVDTSPWTHDAVLRASKQYKNGNNIGILSTHHLPEDNFDDAHTGGVDWNIFWSDKEYALKGQVAASATQDKDNSDAPRSYDTGLAAWTWIGRQGGRHFRTSAQYDYRSLSFNPNHLGYIDRNDLHKLTYHAQFLINEQRNAIYELYTGLQTFFEWNTDGLQLQKQSNLYLSVKWRNRMWTHLGGYGKLSAYDDMEFADGPPLKRIPGGGMWVGLLTPEDEPFGFQFDGNLGTDDTGYYFILKPTFTLRTGRFELELSNRIVRAKNRESYGDTVERDTYDEYILAKRNLIELETGLKSTVVIFRQLTLEMTSQLLSSKAHYHDFRELHPNSRITAATYTDSPDFGKTVLNLQGLLRYEFRPQSVVYLSYTRRGLGEVSHGPYTQYRTFQTIDQYPEQRFLMKLSYLF